MWAWTLGVIDPHDHDAWRLIERKILVFYQTHGTGRLKVLARRIVFNGHDTFGYSFEPQSWDPRYQVDGVRLPVRISGEMQRSYPSEGFTDLPLAQACQLRRLYWLFGCNPATWAELVVFEKVAEDTDMSLVQPLDPVRLMDSACDYP